LLCECISNSEKARRLMSRGRRGWSTESRDTGKAPEERFAMEIRVAF
jgi:hypothetical protein